MDIIKKITLNIVAILCLAFSWGMVHSVVSQNMLAVMTNRDLTIYPVLITSCIMGIFGVRELKVDLTQRRGFLMIISSVTLLIISIFSIYGVRYFLKSHTFCYNKGGCQIELRNLLGELSDYYHDNKTYPPSGTWCDGLYQHKKNKMPRHKFGHYFVCPGANGNQCNFALNPKATKDSSEDVVWLFDSYSEWNQNGGKELLNPNNHEGKGCNILFYSGKIKFIEKDKFDDLKWE